MHETIPPEFPGAAKAKQSSRQEEFGDLSQAADNFGQALDYYRAALNELGVGNAEGRVRLLYKMAECSRRRGDLDSSLQHLKEAKKAHRSLNDPLWTGRLAGRLAATHSDRGNYRHAARYANVAYQLLRHTSEHAELGRADQYLGLARLRMGDYAGSREAFTSALATFRRIDATESMAMCLNNLGLVFKNLGQWGEAIRYLEQALRLNEKIGNYALVAANSLNLGILRYRLGEWDLCEEYLLRAKRIMLETEDTAGEARVHLALGNLHRRRREFDEARKEYQAAEEISSEHHFQRELVLVEEFVGELEMDEGNVESAASRLESVLRDARHRAPMGDLVAEVSNRLAVAWARSNRLEEAKELAEQALSLTLRQGDRCEQAVARRTLGLLCLAGGSEKEATSFLSDSQRSFEELGERYELAQTFKWGAEFAFERFRDTDSLEPFADLLKRSIALYRELGVLGCAGEAALLRARMFASLGHPDQALAEVEHAVNWLRESREKGAEERALEIRREIEEQFVASSLSSSNEFRALEEANQLFRDADDVHSVLSSTVRLAVEHTGGDRGFVAFSSGGGRLEVIATHNLGTERARRMLTSLERATGRDIVKGVPLFASRVAADPRFKTELAKNLMGVFSLVAVPLSFPSQALGLVYVDRLNDNLRGAFNQKELNLLAVLAQSAAVPLVEAQRSVLLEENLALKVMLNPTPGLERIITQSNEIAEIIRLIGKVGPSSATILLQGETGTGKGLLAKCVHEISDRSDGPFVAVNCAALPETLLESELFGHVQGAFTGAHRDKNGLFREAEGGTIFLDEVEKISEPMQAKLLQVLDRGELRPVGATKLEIINVRIVCATNVDLKGRIREGKFLEDLYYRMNDISITVPPLRDRREDIPLLTDHFLRMFGRQMDKPVPELTREVRRILLEHEWRGNVRELEKTIKRLFVLWDGEGKATQRLLPPEMLEATESDGEAPEGFALRPHIERIERRVIREALENSQWNKSQAARMLGVSYPTLLSKIRNLQIDRRKRNGI